MENLILRHHHPRRACLYLIKSYTPDIIYISDTDSGQMYVQMKHWMNDQMKHWMNDQIKHWTNDLLKK